MTKIKAALALMFLFVIFLCASATAEEGLHIVCTSFPCYDFARAVAVENDSIDMLIRPGTEVHAYEPTTGDILSIADCDLFICIGGEGDAWVDDILESLGSDAPDVLRLMDGIDAVEEEITEGMTAEEEHDAEAEYDEHIWTSTDNAISMVGAIAEKMNSLRENSAYAKNAESYIGEIRAIDAQIEAVLSGAVRKEMIFADRFPFLYFVCQYEIEYYAAFPSCSAETEPSAKTIAFLIDKVENDDIPVIYTIEMSNQKTAQTIAEETGAEILTFYSAQTVTEDDFAAGETYVSLMRRNVQALEKGLN